MKHVAMLVGLLLSSVFNPVLATENPNSNKVSNHWLLDEKDQTKRITKLEKYLRGFDQPMLEVGQRYKALYQALIDENYPFATYQWKKIRQTIENGIMKRPARAKNARLMLLNKQWRLINQDFLSADKERAWQGFSKARATCIGCHQAENMGFLNDQPLLRLSRP